MFLKAEPASTGVIRPESVPSRSARLIISGVTLLSSSRYVSVSSSSNSAIASMSAWWAVSAASASCDGTSSVESSVPSAFKYEIAFISTRSTIPENESSWPIGTWMGTGVAPRRSRMDCTAASKSAPVRSILLMNAMRGTR